MTIRLLTVGKLSDPNLAMAAEKYKGRLQHYAGFSWEIVKAERGDDSAVAEIVARESRRILEKWTEKETTVVLDKEGRMFSSEQLAAFLDRQSREAKPLTFVIGGPWGVEEEIKKKASLLLSLSPMTFPHELATVILLEQLYRSFSILNHEKYHK